MSSALVAFACLRTRRREISFSAAKAVKPINGRSSWKSDLRAVRPALTGMRLSRERYRFSLRNLLRSTGWQPVFLRLEERATHNVGAECCTRVTRSDEAVLNLIGEMHQLGKRSCLH